MVEVSYVVAHRPNPTPPNGGMLWGYFGFLKISYVGVFLSYLSCMSLIVTLCSHTRDTSRAQRSQVRYTYTLNGYTKVTGWVQGL